MTLTPDANDRFWHHVMGDVYHTVPQGADLTAIEQAALIPLRERWQAGSIQDNRWVCAVSQLREDGTAVVAPLTLARLDAYACDYWEAGIVSPYSMPPEEQP